MWAYPRPPALVGDPRQVEVRLGGVLVASTRKAHKVLETSHPPTFYLPPEDVLPGALVPAEGRSVCEWKGTAVYWSVVAGGRVAERAAWSYPDPTPEFAVIAGHVSFYPARLECTVGSVPVSAQAGGFYGGWVTPEVVGPFKGEPGSWGW